ncbi:MAG: IscS subfamily cysteine desulfurase, partial [Plesiomonas shigelloides]
TMDGTFGNPASRSHRFGWQAEEAVDIARNQIAELVNADPREIVFTSGATEADNLAIKGVANFYGKKGKHIITCTTEHKAVLDTCRQMEREGFEVTYLDPESNGLVDLAKLEAAMRPDTILVSIMHVNNEIGVIQDIATIGEMCRSRGILFHVDATQSVGKLPIDLAELKVDLMSFSAHKVYGPKGIGALYVRRKPRVRLEAQMHGGGHERGMRSGTLPVHQIVGMGEAYRIAKEEMAEEMARIRTLRDRLWNGLKDMEAVYVNGDLEQRMAGNLNVSFAFVEGESLIMALKDLAVSSGSACTSASLEPSYVLRALGLNDELAHSSIRFSIGRYTTEEEVDYAIELCRSAVTRLRELSPLWDMYKEGIDLNTVEWAHH